MPARKCFVSRLPPQRDGGTIECSPGSAGATPMVPGNGRYGSVIESLQTTRNRCWSTFEIFSHGSVNSSASRPKPGISAVQPQSCGRNSTISISSTSPGEAPLTNTGPLTGLTCVKSSFSTSAAPEVAVICSSEASRTWNSTASPEWISTAGSSELSQT